MASSPLLVTTDTDLAEDTDGEVTVAADAAVTLSGRHRGTMVVQGGATARITGVMTGTLSVESLATAIIVGDVVGAVEIRIAGTLIIEPEGRLAGMVLNFGSFTNRGYRSVVVQERAPDDQPGSVSEPPDWHGPLPRLRERT